MAEYGNVITILTDTVVTVTVDGDSASTDDFASVPQFTVTINAGSSSGTAVFDLTPVADVDVEGG